MNPVFERAARGDRRLCRFLLVVGLRGEPGAEVVAAIPSRDCSPPADRPAIASVAATFTESDAARGFSTIFVMV